MNSPQTEPHATKEGVAFSVVVEFKDHPCVVSKEALFELSRQDPNLDMLKAYKAYESKIHGIARRLVTAGVPGSPLVLHSKHF